MIDYRSIIKKGLFAKIKNNPHYSMRAFSRDIGISHSHISQVLNHKRKLSLESGKKMVKVLALPDGQDEYFFALIEYENTKDPEVRSKILERIRILSPEKDELYLDAEKFKVIGDNE